MTKQIKIVTCREEKLFRQLSKTGLTDRNQAKIFCNLNVDRLQKLKNSNYIKLNRHVVKGKNVEVIRLDDKGKRYCEENFGTKHFAHAQLNHLEHDLKLSLAYYSLDYKTQNSWKHEYEIMNEIYDNHPSMKKGDLEACIDASVVVNGVTIAIEVIGNSYTQADIDLKKKVALNLAGCQSIELIK